MSEAEPNAADTDDARPGKRSRLRASLRHLARLLVLLLLALFAAAVLIGFAPISGAWVDPYLKDRWLDATGTAVDYAAAELTLISGSTRVTAPRLLDPDSGEELLSVDSLDVRVDLLSVARALLDPDQRIQIRSISIQGPVGLHLHEREGRVAPSPRLDRLVALVRARLEDNRSDEGPGVDIEAIMLTDADLFLDRVEGEQSSPLASIRETSVLAEFERGRSVPAHLNLVGKLVGSGGSTGLTLQLEPNRTEEELRLKLRLNPVDTRRHLFARLPLEFQAETVIVEGMLRRQAPGDWIIHTETTTPGVTLLGAGVHGVDHRIDRLVLGSSLRWRNEEKKLNLVALDLKTSDGVVDASGELDLQEPYAYTLQIRDLELRGQAVALTERTFFGESRITTPDRGRLTAAGTISGHASRLKPETVVGSFALEDLSLTLPNLPEPVRSVALTAEISPDAVEVTEATGFVQGLPVQIKGSMLGRPIEGRIDSARFDWRVAGELTGLNNLLAEQASTAPWSIAVRGDVTGGGSIQVHDVELDHWGQLLEKAEIDGRLVLNNAVLRTNRLRPPIEDVRGTVDFLRNRARLTDLAGRIEKLSFGLNGTVEGPDVFWRDSRLDAELDTSFGLEDISRVFEWMDRTPPELPSARGAVRLVGRLQTPFDDPAQARLSGSVRGADLQIQPEGPHLGGLIHLPAVEASLEDHRLTLTRTLGKWGEVDVELTGELSPAGGLLRGQFAGDLEAFPELIPRQASRFDHLGGKVKLQAQLAIDRAEGAPRLTSLAEVWREAAPRAGEPKGSFSWEDFWRFDVNGEVRMDDVALLYETMPETSHLTEVYGTLKFDLEKTWSDEPVYLVPGIGADTSQTSVMIAYNWKDTPSLRLDFDLRASQVDLDNWIEGWRKKKPRVKLDPSKPDRGLDFSLQVRAASDRIVYRGMQGRELTGLLTFKSPRRGEDLLTWEDARAQFKEGRVVVNGRYEKRDRVKSIAHDIEAENIEVADLTQAFLKKQGMIASGRISGAINLKTSSEPDGQLKGAPYQGGGHFRVQDSRFVANAIFRGIGRLLKLDTLFNDISFTRIEGEFRVVDDAVILDRDNPVVFENPSALHPLSLTTSGRIGRGEDTDLLLSLQFFPIVGNIPLVGDIWNALTGRIIRLSVRGSLDDPRVLPATPVL